jgi:hypothetical protein
MIKWQNTDTKEWGHGSPLTHKMAQAWIEQLNKRHQNIIHIIEPFVPDEV